METTMGTLEEIGIDRSTVMEPSAHPVEAPVTNPFDESFSLLGKLRPLVGWLSAAYTATKITSDISLFLVGGTALGMGQLSSDSSSRLTMTIVGAIVVAGAILFAHSIYVEMREQRIYAKLKALGDQMSTELNGLRTERKALEKVKEDLEGQVGTFKEENIGLQTKINSLDTNIKSLKEIEKGLVSQNAVLRNQFAVFLESNKQINEETQKKLGEELNELDQQNDDFSQNNKDQKNNIAKINQAIDKMQELIAKSKVERKTAKNTIKAVG